MKTVSNARSDLPTLTEVVDLTTPAERGEAPQAPLPPQTESVALEPRPQAASFSQTTLAEPYLMQPPPAAVPVVPTPRGEVSLAYDEELLAQVMVRLQPRLEAWVEAQVRRSLMEMLPVWAESASLQIVRDLRSEMPELLSLALDEVHRQRHG
jgi:hypothetical protein